VINLNAADFFKCFEENVKSEPDKYFHDYLNVKEKVKDSSAYYEGKPVEFLYQPMFFTADDIERFKSLTSTLTGILKKVVSSYLKSPQLRKEFGFSPLMEELILVDPGYSIKFPMARYDIFYHYDNNYKFCELNADGSSSMNESRVLHDILYNSHALDGIKDSYRVYDFELFDSWIDSILANYREFNGGRDGSPNIAIMDFEGDGIISEFEVFQKRFVQRGYHTVICDPRELKYIKGKLYFKNNRIDLIYRRATTSRLVDKADDIQDFIRAYKDGAVCVVGGLVSQIIHSKKLFAVLHNDGMIPGLDNKEKEFIKMHVPWTAVFDPDDKNMVNRLKSNRDKLVLKPFDKYAAHGVYIGKDYNSGEWESLIANSSREPYLVQELCDISNINMLTLENKKPVFEKYNYIIGLFMYNHQFRGFYTRAGRKNVIASIAESFTLPNFIVESQ
jgi:hypothetical protein